MMWLLRYLIGREIRQAAEPAGGGGDDVDQTLIDAYRRDPGSDRGRHAASQLLARYRDRVLIWCLRTLPDREAALDAAQETLISAWRNLHRYEDRNRFGAWLFAIARNRCLDELRRRRVPLADEALLEMVADPGPAPDECFERRTDTDTLLALVETVLDDQEREAVMLRCWEGMPVETITRRLGLDSATGARGLLQRARRKLRAAAALGPDAAAGGGQP